MTDSHWGVFLIIGFVMGTLFALGCVVAYSHQWNEEQSAIIAGAYWRGFDDGWNGCGCGQGSGGGESQEIIWNSPQYPNWTSHPIISEDT